MSLKKATEVEVGDPSIWTLFAKDLGSENILARFPVEPTYEYSADGELFVFAESAGERFEVRVEKSVGLAAEPLEFLYEEEGKWVQERIVQTEHHCYYLKSVTDRLPTSHYETFVSSFSIEKNR